MTRMRTALLALPLLIATGCATVVNRSSQRVPITSDPAGAVVSVDCGNAPLYGGMTPTTIEVPRIAEACSINVAKDGYAEERIDLQRQRSRATLANEVPGVVTGTLFSVVALVLTWETDDVDFVVDAYRGGHAIGSGVGNSVDETTGGAYKWVPGKVAVKLQKLPPE